MAASRKSNPSDDADALVADVGTRLEGFLAAGETITVALSGGLDSVVLFDCLVRLRERRFFPLAAIHVDHGLSRYAADWATFCRTLSDANGVPLTVVRVHVVGARGEGLEAAARRARYGAFHCHVSGVLVLAHHLDDQAETVLLQLLRGAGPRGAGAMPSVRTADIDADARLTLVRPLLEVSRSRLADYAQVRRLAWVDDESNADTRLDRNFLRARILPLIAERFPGYRKTLGRSGALFQEASGLLDELADLDGRDAVHSGALDVKVLRGLSEPRARNLLRWFLRERGVTAPPARRLAEAIRQLQNACDGHHVRVVLRDAELCCDAGCLRVRPRLTSVVGSVTWRGEALLAAPCGLGEVLFSHAHGAGISAQSLAGRQVELRLRRGGERIQPDAKRPRRTLKNLLQEHGIDPWRRARLPLLFCDEHLIWVPGIGVDCAWQANAGETSIAPEWRVGNERGGAAAGGWLQSPEYKGSA